MNTPTKTAAVNNFATARACQGDAYNPQGGDTPRSGLYIAAAVGFCILAAPIIVAIFLVYWAANADLSGLHIGGH